MPFRLLLLLLYAAVIKGGVLTTNIKTMYTIIKSSKRLMIYTRNKLGTKLCTCLQLTTDDAVTFEL